MSLKERIESMKLPGHNGPSNQRVVKCNPRLVSLLARQVAKAQAESGYDFEVKK